MEEGVLEGLLNRDAMPRPGQGMQQERQVPGQENSLRENLAPLLKAHVQVHTHIQGSM